MNQTDNCPPWKRKKIEPQNNCETELTEVVQLRVPTYETWKPFWQNRAIAGLDADTRETLVLGRTVVGILNKITWENFEKLSEEIYNLQIDTSRKVQLVVDIIHIRAIVEDKYRILYVRMCDVLRRAQIVNERKDVQSFSTYLVSKCEEYFTQGLLQDVYLREQKRTIDSHVDENLKKSLKEEYILEEKSSRKILVGNCEFIGEMYKLGMISSEMILDKLNQLSRATLFVAVECICTIINSIGLYYEQRIGKFPEKHFVDFESILKLDNIPAWIRYRIRELLNLKNRNWRQENSSDWVRPTTVPNKEIFVSPVTNQDQIQIPQKKSIRELYTNQDKDEIRRPVIEPANIPQDERIEELKMNQDELQFPWSNSANITRRERVQESVTNNNPIRSQRVRRVTFSQELTSQTAGIPELYTDEDQVPLPEIEPVTIPLDESVQESNVFKPAIILKKELIPDLKINQDPILPKRVNPPTTRQQENLSKLKIDKPWFEARFEVSNNPPPRECSEELKKYLVPIEPQSFFQGRVCEALDLLTPHNIGIQTIKMVPLDDVLQFEFIADVVLRKAIIEADNSELFAKLCNYMWNYSVPNENDASNDIEFRTVLLRKCQQLLDKLKPEKQSDEEEQSHFPIENDDKICRIAIAIYQFIAELSKLKISTPEVVHQLIIVLIELKITESLKWIHDLLQSNGNLILLKLKEQGRYVELFQLFSKLHRLLEDERFDANSQYQLYKEVTSFIIGPDAECIVEDIVVNGPIHSVTEYSSTTLFFYLRVIFNICKTPGEEIPEWLFNHMAMFRCKKVIPEAISLFIEFVAKHKLRGSVRTGHFFYRSLKWNLFSQQDIKNGLMYFTKHCEMNKKRQHLLIITEHLQSTKFFKPGDFETILSAKSEPRRKMKSDVDQVTPTGKTVSAAQANLIRQKLTDLTPEDFKPAEFKSKFEDILNSPESMEIAALCLFRLVMMNPTWDGFYVRVCFPILKLTAEEVQFWKVLIRQFKAHFENMLPDDGNSTTKKECSPTPSTSATSQLGDHDWSKNVVTVIVKRSTKKNDKGFIIRLPEKLHNDMRNKPENFLKSYCPNCGHESETLKKQLDQIKSKVSNFDKLLGVLRRKTFVHPIQTDVPPELLAADFRNANGDECIVNLPKEMYNAMRTRIDFDLKLTCSECGRKNELIESQWKSTKTKMQSIDDLMTYLRPQVEFKLIKGHELEKVNLDGKKAFCRFFSSMVNILNNDTADDLVKRILSKCMDTFEIELFCEIYLNLKWKENRFEESLFDSKVPQMLDRRLNFEQREMLKKVAKDFTKEGAHRNVPKHISDEELLKVELNEVEKILMQ